LKTGGVHQSPLIEEVNTGLSPATLFELFLAEPFCFFLDSGMDPRKLGRYSLMGARPFLRIKSRSSKCTIIRDNYSGNTTPSSDAEKLRSLMTSYPGSSHGQAPNLLHQGTRQIKEYIFDNFDNPENVVEGNPFDILGQYLETYRLDAGATHLPCTGGAVGYFSYDLCHFIERLPTTAVDDLQLPECYFGFYDLMLVYDNLLKKAFIVSTGFPELEETLRISRAKSHLDNLKSRIVELSEKTLEALIKIVPSGAPVKLESNFTQSRLCESGGAGQTIYHRWRYLRGKSFPTFRS
jgi:para-aminobenzoate synthetase component I